MAWVRCCGSSKKKVPLIGTLSGLLKLPPSDTSGGTSTKRTFTKNTLVEHLGYDNNYSTSWAYIVNVNNNTLSVDYVDATYGAGIVTNCPANEEYRITFSGATTIRILSYASDGTFLGYTAPLASGSTFTIPNGV